MIKPKEVKAFINKVFVKVTTMDLCIYLSIQKHLNTL